MEDQTIPANCPECNKTMVRLAWKDNIPTMLVYCDGCDAWVPFNIDEALSILKSSKVEKGDILVLHDCPVLVM